LYPIFLNLSDQLCVVVGGGTVALRKVRGLVSSDARVVVISPRLTDELSDLVEKGLVEWKKRSYQSGDLQGALLVFAATNDPQVQQSIAREADAKGQLINRVDDPGECTFQVPATVHRGDLVVAVATGGKSPAVAALLRQQLEESIGSEYEQLLALVAAIRTQLSREKSSQPQRKAQFEKLLRQDILQWIKNGQTGLLKKHVEAVFGPDIVLDYDQLMPE
jgi:precorrin-2 dehydrogenase/sirohydrochlorin ferrochelatase